MFAKWKPIPSVKSPPINFGSGGINTSSPFDISDIELTDALNIDTRAFPAIKVRDGRKLYASVTTPRMLGQRNNQYLMTLDDTVWKYFDGAAWVNILTGLAQADARVEEFVTSSSRISIFSDGTNRKSWDGSTVTDLNNMPATNKFTTYKSRVWCLTDNELKASAINLINDYSTTGEAGRFTMSLANTKGPGTAIINFKDQVIYFSKGSMHKMTGTSPSNYKPIDIDLTKGCISDRSLVAVTDVLMWLGEGFIFSYSGAYTPDIVLYDKLKGYLNRINWTYANKSAGGTDGQRYYLAVPIDGSTTNNIVLVIDIARKIFSVESGTFMAFTNMGGKLYGVQYDGKIKDMANGTDDDGTAISWNIVSKPWSENTLAEKKSLQKLYLVVDLPTGSTLTVSVSTDAEGSNFTTVKSITANANMQNARVDIPINLAHNTDWYRVKMSGTGPCTLYKAQKQLRIIRRG